MKKSSTPLKNAKEGGSIQVRRSPRVAYNTSLGVDKGKAKADEVVASKHLFFKDTREADDDDFVSPPGRKKQLIKERPDVPHFEYDGTKIQPRVKAAHFHDFINGLNNEQREVVRNMGFGSLLDVKLRNIPIGLGYWLVKNYYADQSVLNVEGKWIFITADSVEDLLGIQKGSVEVTEVSRPRSEDEVVKRFRSQFSSTNGKISHLEFLEYVKKYEKYDCNFKVNFLVVFATYLGDITKNNTINQRFLPSLKDINRVKEYNWCEYVVNSMRRTRGGWNDTRDYTGSMIVLALAYAEERYGKKRNFTTNLSLKAVTVITDSDLISLYDKKNDKLFTDCLSHDKKLPTEIKKRAKIERNAGG